MFQKLFLQEAHTHLVQVQALRSVVAQVVFLEAEAVLVVEAQAEVGKY